ncbi:MULTISPECIES: multidrug efflux SMR transporter [Bacillaceae]|uniref:DMT family transporter n=1 Tax=Bacillaceae TaxID=186817 RepID=UPI001E42C763|nr:MULTISPECIES: multidrug efflux SMR transporter [Bacillaceae]MCE4048067.1 multidrug efflux SMR transporter [Bacillus sp. Au-Bac7]MCM3032645.1 multidrug efflux SMR transporter [Niallia sp. MER 6]MDL0434409.1 multidrug efflux SMR transporter [Niallia sp. SS-2023]UPO89151.1 multidrug efflux SMR transporter [Niallia sp. Man26]
MNRHWIMVLAAGLMEVVWVSGLKHANSVIEWAGTIAAIIISFVVLIYATRYLPVGTVYAVFTGLGTMGTVIAEMVFFGEPFRIIKLVLVVVLLVGVVGLKLVTDENSTEGEGS